MDTLQRSSLGDLPLDAKKNTEQCNSFFKLLSCRLFSKLFFFFFFLAICFCCRCIIMNVIVFDKGYQIALARE